MVRVETDNTDNQDDAKMHTMEKEIARLKKDLKHKQSRKFFNCGTCSLLFFIFLVGFGGIAAYVLALSGLWQIPFFSDNFYQEPTPYRLVNKSEFNNKQFISRIENALQTEARVQKKTDNLQVNINLNDEEMTSLLREQAGISDLKGKIEFLQINAMEDGLEIFIKTKSPRNFILTLKVRPEIKDNKLRLKVEKLKIGQLSLPHFIGQILIENITQEILNNLLSASGKIGTITKIDTYNNNLQFLLSINNFNLIQK
jgi:hypothetical protein